MGGLVGSVRESGTKATSDLPDDNEISTERA
jgi:hypothetical protein